MRLCALHHLQGGRTRTASFPQNRLLVRDVFKSKTHAVKIFLTSPSRSPTTLQGVLKVMVGRFSESYAGQCGSPEWFGFPVLANATQVVLTILASDCTCGSLPRSKEPLSTLSNAKGISIVCGARKM